MSNMLQITYHYTMFVLDREYKIHVNTTREEFPLARIPIETIWHNTPTFRLLTLEQQANSKKYLIKLYMYGITTIQQIQHPSTTSILTLEEFQTKYKASSKPIKEALQQASNLFPPTNFSMHTTQTNITNTRLGRTNPSIGSLEARF